MRRLDRKRIAQEKAKRILEGGCKTCNTCRQKKPLIMFRKESSKRGGSLDGYRGKCKECTPKKKYKKTLLKIGQYHCQWCRNEFKSNYKRDCCTEECRKEYVNKLGRDRYAKDEKYRERKKQLSRLSHKRNPYLMLARKHKRKSNKEKLNDGTVTATIIKKILNSRKRCPYCGGKLTKINIRLDHIDPIKRGGLHTANNLTPCCYKCNSFKSAKPFYIWIQYLKSPYKERAVNFYFKHHNSVPDQVSFRLIYAKKSAGPWKVTAHGGNYNPVIPLHFGEILRG